MFRFVVLLTLLPQLQMCCSLLWVFSPDCLIFSSIYLPINSAKEMKLHTMCCHHMFFCWHRIFKVMNIVSCDPHAVLHMSFLPSDMFAVYPAKLWMISNGAGYGFLLQNIYFTCHSLMKWTNNPALSFSIALSLTYLMCSLVFSLIWTLFTNQVTCKSNSLQFFKYFFDMSVKKVKWTSQFQIFIGKNL